MSRTRVDGFEKLRRFTQPEYSRRQTVPVLAGTSLKSVRIDVLRWAIRTNQVTFPSQIPTFGKHDRPDLQWKFAQLYFVLGWNCEGIAAKYGMIHQRVRQVLNAWKRRAVETGYLQFIPPVSECVPVMQTVQVQVEDFSLMESYPPFVRSGYSPPGDSGSIDSRS